MAAAEIAPRIRPIDGLDADAPTDRRSWFLPAVIVAAWAIAAASEGTGMAAGLHHHALIEGGSSLGGAIPLFLAGWLVMVTAMMLPASLPAVRRFQAESRGWVRSDHAVAVFLAAYGSIWAAFGLFTFMGDVALHQVVEASPWLAAQPWLIEATVLTLAGGYQLLPLKRRWLAACRHRHGPTRLASWSRPSPVRHGLRHGLECLGSSWALMLVMFAAGFASVWSMAALTVVMVYETTGRHGQRAAAAAGIFLLMAALTVVSGAGPGP